jgi:hypothetical protein
LHSIDMHFLSDDVIICSATDVVNADISVMLNLKCLEGHICPMKYFCHWPKGPYRSHYVMIMLWKLLYIQMKIGLCVWNASKALYNISDSFVIESSTLGGGFLSNITWNLECLY